MQKADSNSSAGTKDDSEQKVEDMQASQHNAKPLVVGSQSQPSIEETDIWSHPLNKDVPQKSKQLFNTMKAYLESCPKDDKGNSHINEAEFVRLMNSFDGCNLKTSM